MPCCLHGLLSALFARGLTSVTTANTRPEDLYRNGLQRQRFLPAIDLLQRHTRVFELDGGSDYRLRALTQSGRLRRRERRSGGDRSAPDGLFRSSDRRASTTGRSSSAVNGRTFPVRRRGADVIWFDFDASAARARSAGDYIEIAREFHTVLLSGVPVLGSAHEAAARRFVHLVDEFYDQRVKLILSTATPIAGSMPGGSSIIPTNVSSAA
jgi:cell division protein ZapE